LSSWSGGIEGSCADAGDHDLRGPDESRLEIEECVHEVGVCEVEGGEWRRWVAI
jgi:hypothetical protein